MAVAFVLIAMTEFAHIMAHMHEGLFPWLVPHENLNLITHPLMLVAGLGIIWYLFGVKKNLKDYM